MNEKTIYIENNIERYLGMVVKSDIQMASEDDIKRISSKPCDHDNQSEQLVYDEIGIPFDLRYCAICDEYLGTV